MENLPQVVKKEVFDFMVPSSYERAKEIAEGLARSRMVPKHYQGNPTDIIIAMSYGAQLGLSPVIALNGIAVINGAPSLWGGVFWGLVLSCPVITNIKEDWSEKDKTWNVTIERQRKGKKEIHIGTFSFEEAEFAGLLSDKDKQWTWGKYPKDMCRWKARSRAGKSAISDYLCGLGLAEDIEIIDVSHSIVDKKPAHIINQPQTRIEETKANLLNKIEEKKETEEEKPKEKKKKTAPKAPPKTAPASPPKEEEKVGPLEDERKAIADFISNNSALREELMFRINQEIDRDSPGSHRLSMTTMTPDMVMKGWYQIHVNIGFGLLSELAPKENPK